MSQKAHLRIDRICSQAFILYRQRRNERISSRDRQINFCDDRRFPSNFIWPICPQNGRAIVPVQKANTLRPKLLVSWNSRGDRFWKTKQRDEKAQPDGNPSRALRFAPMCERQAVSRLGTLVAETHLPKQCRSLQPSYRWFGKSHLCSGAEVSSIKSGDAFAKSDATLFGFCRGTCKP